MNSINMLNFSEALELARVKANPPYLIRLADLNGEKKINIKEVRHHKYVESDCLGKETVITYEKGETGQWVEHASSIKSVDLLANDYIQPSQWEIIE